MIATDEQFREMTMMYRLFYWALSERRRISRCSPTRPAVDYDVGRLDATESPCFATRRRKPVIIDC